MSIKQSLDCLECALALLCKTIGQKYSEQPRDELGRFGSGGGGGGGGSPREQTEGSVLSDYAKNGSFVQDNNEAREAIGEVDFKFSVGSGQAQNSGTGRHSDPTGSVSYSEARGELGAAGWKNDVFQMDEEFGRVDGWSKGQYTMSTMAAQPDGRGIAMNIFKPKS